MVYDTKPDNIHFIYFPHSNHLNICLKEQILYYCTGFSALNLTDCIFHIKGNLRSAQERKDYTTKEETTNEIYPTENRQLGSIISHIVPTVSYKGIFSGLQSYKVEDRHLKHVFKL